MSVGIVKNTLVFRHQSRAFERERIEKACCGGASNRSQSTEARESDSTRRRLQIRVSEMSQLHMANLTFFSNVRVESEFLIDASEALTSPNSDARPAVSMYGKKADVPVEVTPLGNGVFRASYTAVLPG